ncbi:Phenylserine dehydratase [Tsuneonella dongtanensis]|uniref:Phenylserine dehydratase n=1 Tax=Tsuneonella dongtanensis TaxID=692370 RepID=A0A1B2ADY5_9SPHN|nr:threonine/serine dehydratase [Tsuneonella dongtanensis]ANY20372.1 Phenylserine dehydratase [Tsuneonella dongtanensis]
MFRESPREPTRDGVVRAAEKVAAIVQPTPLLPIEVNGVRIHAKCDNLQPIGAFKIRGAWHRLTDLSPEERAAGVVAVSSGNHAQGVAWAARELGIEAAIVMPADAPQVKLDATRALGAEVILYDRAGGEDRDVIANALCDERGRTLVHAYADPWVIEGQGSMGIEIAAQLGRQPSRIVVCCGGGGLAAGLALSCPDSAIVPVEPEGWDDMAKSLATGTIQRVGPNPPKTACDAIQTPSTAPLNFAVLNGRSDPGIAVSDAEVRAAQRFAFSRLHVVVEPGGAAALAAALAGKVALDPDTVVTLTGGNTDPHDFAAVIARDD